MSKFIGNNSFKNGFTLGVILILLAQITGFLKYFFLTVWLMATTPAEISFHAAWDIGFPFSMYYGNYSFFQGHIEPYGLAKNLLVGLGLSFIIGLIFKFWIKDKSQKFN